MLARVEHDAALSAAAEEALEGPLSRQARPVSVVITLAALPAAGVPGWQAAMQHLPWVLATDAQP